MVSFNLAFNGFASSEIAPFKSLTFFKASLFSLRKEALIFLFSAADGDESSKTSSWVGRTIAKVIYSDFESWSEEKQEEYIEKIEYPIRKTAHASEYALLAMLVFGAIGPLPGKKKDFQRYAFSWLITTLYAGSDEFHQLFVEGRSGQFTDVCIDSAGALAGLLILAGCLALGSKMRKSRERKSLEKTSGDGL